MTAEEYINATELAKKFNVSKSTIHRRIKDRTLKDIKKVKKPFGEYWIISKKEADSMTLEKLSPKLYQQKTKTKSSRSKESKYSKATQASIEERLSALERAFIQHIGDK